MDTPTTNGHPNHLRELRLKAGLAQEALARRANVSTNTIVRLETKPALPSLSTARKVAGGLRVTVAEIWPDDVAEEAVS
jgi:DNA-binding XRE family transcriptional regulator